MKKLLSLLLTVSLLLSLCGAAIADEDLAFQKFDHVVEVHIGMAVEPTDVTLEEGDTVDNNYYTRYLLDNYNIKVVVDWTAATGDDFNQKVALTIASDSLPDAVVVSDRTYFTAAAEDDMLYDLTEVFDRYASDQVKAIHATTNGKAAELVSSGGKMLALPNISVAADGVLVMMMQQNWLDELGLAVPTTVQELHDAAVAIRDAKPAGERTIPILGAQKDSRVYADFLHSNFSFGFDAIFAAMNAYPGYFVLDGENKVQYGTLSAETRAALEMLAQWYAEGLIDPEFATRDYSQDVVNANECGFFCGPWWALGYGNGDSFKNSETVDWQAYPLFTDDGVWNAKMKTLGTSYTLVNCNVSEEVAAAIVIINNVLVANEAVFQNETAEDIEWYPLRNVLAAMDECEYTYRAEISVLNGETEPDAWQNEPNYKLLAADTQVVRSIVPGYKQGEILHRADFLYTSDTESNFQRQYALLIGDRPYATVELNNPVYSVTYTTNETIDRYWANLEALEGSVIRSIITGKSDISAFDAFVEQWMAEGGEKILQSVQEEYDAAQ